MEYVDADRPDSAAPLAVALSAARCSAIVTANSSRADLPQVISERQRWISWITQPRVPAYSACASGDGLVLADRAFADMARRAGWPEDRLAIGGWPIEKIPMEAADTIGLIADATSINAPAFPYSSHRLLWDLIERELAENPFAAGLEPGAFLSDRQRRLKIADDGLDRRLFLERLIVPGYVRGVASVLIDAGVPLRLYGEGWSDRPAFAARYGGPVRSREDLLKAVSANRNGTIRAS